MPESTDRQCIFRSRSLLLAMVSMATFSLSLVSGLPGEMETSKVWASDAGGLVPVDPPGKRPEPQAATPVVPDLPPVRISAPNDLTRFNTLLGTQFKTKVPGSNVEISSRGVEDALEAVQSGEVDIAVSDRPLTDQEISQGLASVPIGGSLAYVYNSSSPSDTTQPFLDFVEEPDNQSTLQQALSLVPSNPDSTNIAQEPETAPGANPAAEGGATSNAPLSLEQNDPPLASDTPINQASEPDISASSSTNDSNIALVPSPGAGVTSPEGTGRSFPWGWLLVPMLGLPFLFWLRRGQSSQDSTPLEPELKPEPHSEVSPVPSMETPLVSPTEPGGAEETAQVDFKELEDNPPEGSSPDGLSSNDSERSGLDINPAIAATGLAAGAIGLAAPSNNESSTTDDHEITSDGQQSAEDGGDSPAPKVTNVGAQSPGLAGADNHESTTAEEQASGVANDTGVPNRTDNPALDSEDEWLESTNSADISTEPTAGEGGIDSSGAIAATGLATGAIGLAALSNTDCSTNDHLTSLDPTSEHDASMNPSPVHREPEQGRAEHDGSDNTSPISSAISEESTANASNDDDDLSEGATQESDTADPANMPWGAIGTGTAIAGLGLAATQANQQDALDDIEGDTPANSTLSKDIAISTTSIPMPDQLPEVATEGDITPDSESKPVTESHQIFSVRQPDVAPSLAQVEMNHIENNPLTIDSQTNTYVLDEQKLAELQSLKQNTTALDPGGYIISIESGHFSSWTDNPDFPGEPLAILRLYGGRFINRKTNVETTSTWTTLNGYNDVLSIDVQEPITLSAMFFDVHKEENSGQITLLVLKEED